MDVQKLVANLLLVFIAEAFVIGNDNITNKISDDTKSDSNIELDKENEEIAGNVFDGVYTECFLYLSYSCLQTKTLLYLKELNKLSEVSVFGEYVKFVKVNESEIEDVTEISSSAKDSEELSFMIDKAVDKFFNNHILKFSALGKDVSMPHTVEEFVGRKRKGGGGGGGGHGGGGHDDGGKKKMMMMAMMCMKMKFMMMVPAMMGMMGMMSFKGMMFSMMSFMISKMMLLMKILEKKGGGIGGGGGGGDGGWAAGGGGGGGGAWMPAGGQDGGGGGYDANGQWQSRSILEHLPEHIEAFREENKPIITYVTPIVRYNNNINGKKPFSVLKNLNDEVIKINQDKDKPRSRNKRGIVDMLQNTYLYWVNRVLGVNSMKYYPKYPKYKVVQGVKYVYYPIRQVQKVKTPKELPVTDVQETNNKVFQPIVTEEFNKGEIVEGPEERSLKKKLKDLNKFNADVNDAIEDSPWQ